MSSVVDNTATTASVTIHISSAQPENTNRTMVRKDALLSLSLGICTICVIRMIRHDIRNPTMLSDLESYEWL
jgi:hypothetical protein